jgi:copper chaperone CopZ
MDKNASLELVIEGMDCQGCVRSVENAIRREDPAAEISIDLASGAARVGTVLERARVVSAIEGAGFDVAGA